MTELNDLVVARLHDVLTTAHDIDDFGRITGQGFDDDGPQFVAYLAEPAS